MRIDGEGNDERLRAMVDDLMDRGNLTKWEQGFLYGLADKFDHSTRLSAREREKLEQIYDERA